LLIQSGFEDEIAGDEFTKRFGTMHTEEIENFIQQRPKLHLYEDELLKQVMATHPVPRTKEWNQLKVTRYI
jgi:hypothetical protein